MKQLQRIFEIDRRIRAGLRPTAQSLAETLEVSKRQIFLDRKFLAEALGAPLATHRNGGWIYTNNHWSLPTVYLSEGEVLAFFLSIEIAQHSGNAGLNEVLQGAVAKIAQGLGTIVSVDLNTLRNTTSFGLSPAARVNSQTYLSLHRAGADRKKVKMLYYSASSNESKQRIVHPYHLHFTRGECLLLAFDELRHQVRCFNIARIKKFDVLNARFEQQPHFNVQSMLRSMLWAEAGHQLYNIAIRFDEYQTRYIRERTWHEDETLEFLPDEGSILRFPASSLAEVSRFVLGFGQHAEALEPPELRELIMSHLEGLNRTYKGTKENDD